MKTTNLDIYGDPPIPWSRAQKQLEMPTDETTTHFLATVRPDGRPHIAGVGALWADDRFYVVSGPNTRKSRNLAERSDCAISVKLTDLDIVMEGTARRVTDAPTLERVATLYNTGGWPVKVEGDAFSAPYSAPSAGPPPWYLYEFTPTKAFGVAFAEPHGATRWEFDT